MSQSALQVYEPFYADFGPLNLGLAFSFCQKTRRLLEVGTDLHRGSCLRKQAASQQLPPRAGFHGRNRLCLTAIMGLACRKETG